ncbi:MAG: hypothetical protein IK113_00035 [Bacteroidales bacterium]|nr:hypothetical protein [Bacteroidales bacterium]
MRKNFIYLFVAAAALLAISCQKKEADTYQPAEPVSGAQYFFPSSVEKSYKLSADLTALDITISRMAKDAASTAKIAVTDTSKTVFAEGKSNVTAEFKAGEKESKVSLPIDMSKYNYGDLYGLDLAIQEETTPYGASALHIEINLPEPWTSLGKGTFIDKFWGWETALPVEILQSDLDPDAFRLVDPYGNAPECTTNGYIKLGGEPAEFFDFRLLKKGQEFAGVTVSMDDLVYFNYDLVGYYYNDGSNEGAMEIDHPAAFSSLRTEDKWTFNKVLSYQENGLPAQIQWAPYYYIDGLGGFNKTQVDDMITITFPGVVVADYSISFTFEGVISKTGTPDAAMVNLAFDGADVTEVALAVIPGADDPSPAFELIEKEDENVIVVSAPGVVKVPIPEGSEPGKYSVVAVPISEEGAEVKFVQSEGFVYGNLSPLQLEYSSSDFVDGISKADLLGKTWVAFATDDEHGPVDREAYSYITFEEAEDIADDSDRILAHGFSYGGGDYYGFSDDLYMEYYKGTLYTLENEVVGQVSGYDIIPTYASDDSEVIATDDYVMCGAYVADGIIALVSAEDSVNFTQIWFAGYKGGNCAGWFTCMNYILLVDPDIVDVPLSAPARVKNLFRANPKVEKHTAKSVNNQVFTPMSK